MSMHRYFLRPEGPKYGSLGQRTRSRWVRKLRPVGPAHRAARGVCFAPLGLGNFLGDSYPGRCPGLSSFAPLVLKKILTRLAKLEDEIAKDRKELEGLLK